MIPPTGKSPPIHDSSAIVIGPVVIGDSFDCKISVAGDNHPMTQPWANVKMLTKIK